MPLIFQVAIDGEGMNEKAFTFVEIMVALTIAGILIMVSSSVLFTILRMDASGQAMLQRVLSIQQMTYRHFIPDLRENQPVLSSATTSLAGFEKRTTKKGREWVVYSLTTGTEVVSMNYYLNFKQ